MNRRQRESLYFTMFRACGALVVLALVVIIGYMLIGGAGAISWDFLTQPPKRSNTEGGILTPLVGTLYLMAITFVFAIPVGILSAVYLVEYQRPGRVSSFWRIVVANLAGVPSIVYGLLGLGLFVYALGFGRSLLASGLTLGVLVLPVVIAASREAIQAVPPSVRQAALALGATKWQTVRHHVLPYAMPGILTGVILSLSRAAGETAPILLTGVAFYMSGMPDSLFSQFMALPYHIYSVATQTVSGMSGSPMVYGSALVLLALVIGMNVVAIVIRKKYREKYRW
ncbi:MAG: phosphate ABC transporter permease PstA [Methanomassiliicoccus sp.]|nr:phosphate ABC transporter permease PstA [Methanomassiliicoccus sp.]